MGMRPAAPRPAGPSLRAVHLVVAASLATVLAGGCGTFLAAEEDPPTPPAGNADADADGAGPINDAAAAPDSATNEGGTCPGGSAPEPLTLVASADTSFTRDCNGDNTYGREDFMHVGLENGLGVGLVRFHLTDAEAALLAGATIVGGRLDLTANPNCGACGGGLPTKAGTISIHPLRPDWDEGSTGGEGDGADRCRREKGKGWGNDRPPSSGTSIQGGGVDFDDAADTTAVADDAKSVTIYLAGSTITARDAIAAKRISLLVRMVSGGRMLVATHEKSSTDAPKLEITYCK